MNFAYVLKLPTLLIFAYMLGSVPWGFILTKLFTPFDIRQKGSGNIGATNVRRIAGNRIGIITLAGDVFKGAFPVYLAIKLTGVNGFWAEIYVSLIAISVLSGHLFPVFLKFKGGGKGVATAAGCFIIISPIACFFALLTFIMLICLFNRVSVASLGATLMLPVAVWKATNSKVMAICAACISILICLRHIENIKRLLSGKEPVIWSL
jgi:glycerol-3-phosphate acyltransferase PlsY